METVGDRLKKARLRKDLTQKNVSDLTGITDKSLSRYENDKTEPDNDSLRRLAETYEVSADWIIGRDEKNKKENGMPLPRSKLDEVVERIEKKLNVKLADDPLILEGIENYLITMGKVKQDHS